MKEYLKTLKEDIRKAEIICIDLEKRWNYELGKLEALDLCMEELERIVLGLEEKEEEGEEDVEMQEMRQSICRMDSLRTPQKQ